MKRLASLLSLLLALSLAVEAAPLQHRVELRSSAGSATTREIRISPAPGEIIIEFDATPLLLQSPDERGAASASMDALFARLEHDLAEIAGRTEPAVAKRADAPRVEHRYTLAFAGASARVDPGSVARIRELEYIRRVHPDRISTAYLSSSTTTVGAPQFWADHGVRGAGAVVAILDTGIDYTHPAFGGELGPGKKVRGGKDFVNNDSDPMDDEGHGTHVAGIVAADGGGLVGVAPDATLLAYKVLDSSGSGRDSWILGAIDQAVRDGAHIVNMSLGRAATSNDPVTTAVENASEAGVLFCVAAGNGGRFLDIGTPGNAPSAITVGATDGLGRVASFSSKGPVVPTGAIKPELVAPGVDIVSAAVGGGTLRASGTSMASPHVAGVAALLRSIRPDWSAAALRAILIGSARPVDAEVMARGAGSIHAVDAAKSRIFPSTNALAFGITDPRSGAVALNHTVTFVNGLAEPKTVSIEIDGLRDGIALTPSETTVTLPPGELRDVRFDLSFDPAKIPAPEAGSLSFGGSIRLVEPASSLTIPWGFVVASKVRVRWNGPESATVRLGTARMLVEGWTSPESPEAGLFVGAGSVSLWLSSGFPFGSVVRHVIRENLDLESGAELLTLGPEDAPHRILFHGRDLDERLLSDRGDLSLAELVFRHPHFEMRPLETVTLLFSEQEVYVSDFDGETRLLAFQRAFDLEPSAMWHAQYPPIERVDGKIELIIAPEDWTPLAIRAFVPADLENPYQSLLAAVRVDTSHGAITGVSGPATHTSANEPGALARGWITRTRQEDSGTSLRFEIGESGGGEAGLLLFSSADVLAEFTSLEEGIIPGNSSHPRLSDPILRPGDPIVIGEGPIHGSAFVSRFGETAFASAQWFGPLGETRLYDTKRMSGGIYDSDGVLVAPGIAPPRHTTFLPIPFQVLAELPGPGAYSFEAVNGSFEVAGIPALATIHSTFDFGREDGEPPALTSLRVLDGAGRPSATVRHGSASTLTFSAVDLAGFGFGPVRGERTVVEYRIHDAGDGAPWIPLTAVEVGEDFAISAGLPRAPDGTLYRVDLGAVTAAASGAVDVRISVEDAAGNASVYALEPAFVVRGGRARTVERQ